MNLKPQTADTTLLLKDAREVYFALWVATMPFLSTLIVPSVQGTVPAYLLAFGSLVFSANRRYLRYLSVFAISWLTCLIASQMMYQKVDIELITSLPLLEEGIDPSAEFRRTIWTQSLYMFACVLTFCFSACYYQSRWLRYLYFASWLLVAYALYDWAYATWIGEGGDFLANRIFESTTGNQKNGSWQQETELGFSKLKRLKGSTGEPSHFSIISVPFLAIAWAGRKLALSASLLLCIVLTFSTGSILGLILLLLLSLARRPTLRSSIFALSFILASIALLSNYPDFLEKTIEKISGSGVSGSTRMNWQLSCMNTFTQLPIISQLFGLGVGTVYAPGAAAFLLNTGLIGLCVWATLFLKPLATLGRDDQSLGIWIALGVLLMQYIVYSAQIWYPTTWLIAGIGWKLANPPHYQQQQPS